MTIEHTYDATGARSRKTVGGVTTNYIYNSSDLVYESGAKTARYLYGGGIVGMVGTNGEYYHIKNGHGDVTQLTNASGTVTEDYDYDAFGNQADETSSIYNPFRYSGEYFDEETGFVYLRNRYYDTTTGRFITEDPVKDGLNWYVYCANNPVMFVDPSGLTPTKEEAAAMAKQLYNFNNKSNLADVDITQRTVSLLDGRTWEMHDLWVNGTVIMGVYQLVDGNGGYTELSAVFQGTSTLVDWVDNIDAYVNTFSPNLIHARLFGKGLIDYHSDVETTFVGHSKGGGEAIAAALHTGKNAITFNAANFDFGNPIVTWWQSRNININNFYVDGEILSFAIGSSSVGTNYPLAVTGTPLYKHSIDAVIEGF